MTATRESVPSFTITSVKPVVMWAPEELQSASVKCHLCLRRVTDTSGARVSGDIVVHRGCKKAFHDSCLSSYFQRPVPANVSPMDCPNCKAAWNVDAASNFNVFSLA